MNIISYVSTPSASELFYQVARALSENGHELAYITESQQVIDFMLEKNLSVYNLRPLFEKNFEKYRTMDLDEKKKILEKKYKWADVDHLTKADSVLWRETADKKYSFTLSYLDAWNKYLLSNKPDLVASSDATEVPNMVYGELASQMKIPVLYSNHACIFPKRMFWDRHIMLDSWVDRSLLDEEPGKVEREYIEKYIDNTIATKPMIGFLPKKPLSSGAISKSIDYFVRCILTEEQKSRYFTPAHSLKFGVGGLVRRPIASGYYKKHDLKEPFVFFPFHVPYDAQVTFRGSAFRDQGETAKMIAAALPEGYTLYAKPHPHSTGQYPLSWFKSLSKLPNVKLIDPGLSAHVLVEHCKAVVTINSDVGWEALLYGKPVVVLAKPFYSRMGYTIDVDKLDELPAKIAKALKQKRIPREKITRLVSTAYRSTVEGSYYTPDGEFDTNYENAKNIAEGIIGLYERSFED